MSKLNGCHDRKPFAITVTVQEGWINMAGSRIPEMKTIPFQMAPDCQYSLSDLGQIDPGCNGCKWRQRPQGA